MIATAVLLGFANWIATTILVESELTRPVREWVDFRYVERGGDGRTWWAKVRYLIGCHLCTGTWIGFAEAAFVRLGIGPAGIANFVLSALVFKAIGHTVLNINAVLSRAASSA